MAVSSGPGPDKPFAELTEQDCTIINVEISGVSDDKAALWLQHGTWHLQGYFADHGWVDTWMGRTTYRLTVLSDVEAVT